MTDPFNSAPKKLEPIKNLEDQDKKDEETLIAMYGNYDNARKELWKLLIAAGISPEDKAPGEKSPYTYYSITKLAKLLEEITEEEIAA